MEASMTRAIKTLFISFLLLLCLAVNVTARDVQRGREIALAGNMAIIVYTYRPSRCRPRALLFVFAGLNRNAASYRNRARRIADRACALVFAPLLDRERFANWRYHRAGVYRKGRVQPRARWTGPVLQELIDWAKKRSGLPEAPYMLFGHSAGGQLLSRIAAYSPPRNAARIIIANPSVHVAPALDVKVPYGFGKIFDKTEGTSRLRAYLALPITIYLGAKDSGQKHLVKSRAAMRQGLNRFLRGKNIFHAARKLALEKGWPFNWQLITVPGVGHSSTGMLNAPQALRALGLRPVAAQ